VSCGRRRPVLCCLGVAVALRLETRTCRVCGVDRPVAEMMMRVGVCVSCWRERRRRHARRLAFARWVERLESCPAPDPAPARALRVLLADARARGLSFAVAWAVSLPQAVAGLDCGDLASLFACLAFTIRNNVTAGHVIFLGRISAPLGRTGLCIPQQFAVAALSLQTQRPPPPLAILAKPADTHRLKVLADGFSEPSSIGRFARADGSGWAAMLVRMLNLFAVDAVDAAADHVIGRLAGDADHLMAIPIPNGITARERADLLDHHGRVVEEIRRRGWRVRSHVRMIRAGMVVAIDLLGRDE